MSAANRDTEWSVHFHGPRTDRFALGANDLFGPDRAVVIWQPIAGLNLSLPRMCGTVFRQDELRGRRHQSEQAARSLLGLKDPESPLVQSELKRLNGENKSLDASIRSLESATHESDGIELSEVTSALQRLDPVWEVLYPEEQRRVLELLIESITVDKKEVAIQFRANGVEQIVEELKPMSERENGKSKKKK